MVAPVYILMGVTVKCVRKVEKSYFKTALYLMNTLTINKLVLLLAVFTHT